MLFFYLSLQHVFLHGDDFRRGHSHEQRNIHMTVMKMPTGLSLSDARKQAKRLSKTSQSPLNEMQDAVAQQHSRSTWAQHQHLANSLRSHLFTLKEVRPVVPNSARRLTTISGPSDSLVIKFLFAELNGLMRQHVPIVLLLPTGADNPNKTKAHCISVAKHFQTQLHQLKKHAGQALRIVECSDDQLVNELHSLPSLTWQRSSVNVHMDELPLNGSVVVMVDPLNCRHDSFLISPHRPAWVSQSRYTLLICHSMLDTSFLEWPLTEAQDKHVDASFVVFEKSPLIDPTLGWNSEFIDPLARQNYEREDGAALLLIRPQHVEIHTQSDAGWQGQILPETPADTYREGNAPSEEDSRYFDSLVRESSAELSNVRKAWKASLLAQGLVDGLPTLVLSPTLFISRNMRYDVGLPKLNHYQLTIEIPKLNITQTHTKFVRSHHNPHYISLPDRIYLQLDMFTWISLEDEELEIIYHWTTKSGISIRHTLKAMLYENLGDNPFSLDFMYHIDADRYSFNDPRTVISQNQDQDAANALQASPRGQAGLVYFAADGKWGATLSDQFDCSMKCMSPS